MSFSTKIIPTKGEGLEELLTQALSTDPIAAASAATKSVEKLNSIVRRSLVSVGIRTFKALKAGFRQRRLLGLDKKAVYTKTGVVMSNVLAAVRPQELKTMTSPPEIKGQGVLGGNLGKMMQFDVPKDESSLTVGLIPRLRGGKKWAKRFAKWQEGGAVDLSEYYNGNVKSMRGFLAALGMPLRRGTMPTAPKRPIIAKIQDRMNPSELFKRAFLERLRR